AGECFYLSDDEFPPLQAADMYAAWTRRLVSPNQMWTAADRYLGRIERLKRELRRESLERLVDSSTSKEAIDGRKVVRKMISIIRKAYIVDLSEFLPAASEERVTDE